MKRNHYHTVCNAATLEAAPKWGHAAHAKLCKFGPLDGWTLWTPGQSLYLCWSLVPSWYLNFNPGVLETWNPAAPVWESRPITAAPPPDQGGRAVHAEPCGFGPLASWTLWTPGHLVFVLEPLEAWRPGIQPRLLPRRRPLTVAPPSGCAAPRRCGRPRATARSPPAGSGATRSCCRIADTHANMRYSLGHGTHHLTNMIFVARGLGPWTPKQKPQGQTI